MASQDLPEPVDLSHHLSRVTKNRNASSIKSFYKYFAIPGIGQLAGGLPNDHYFPFDTLEAKVSLPERWKPTDNKPVDPPKKQQITASSSSSEPPAAHLVVPKKAPTANPLRKIDLASALQYGTAQGYPPLYQFLRQFTTQNLHPNIPYKGGAEIILTCGSTDGFSKAIQALNNEWTEGHDPIWAKEGLLVEEYAYMNAVQTARPRGMNIVPVGIDDQGMRASGKGGLRDVLENWDYSKGARPHLMYTVTIGQNPTSGTLSVTRRKDIYAICQKYDIIIIEDDPYWYLQFPPSSSDSESATAPPAITYNSPKSSGYAFLDSLVPSYLSVDTEGRVIRLDTFSKTVAPGCRLGWVTAQPALIERMQRITEVSTQQPSGFVQSMIAELLIGPAGTDDDDKHGKTASSGWFGARKEKGETMNKGWNMDGWVRWLEGLRGEYQHRMEEMSDILREGATIVSSRSSTTTDWTTLKTTHPYDFVRPLAGMFIWTRFDFSCHPLASKVAAPRLSKALWVNWTTPKYRVLVVPGFVFAPTPEIRDQDAHNCFRLCFAAIERDQLRPVTQRFVDGVRYFWSIKDVKVIDELLKDEDPSASLAKDFEGLSVKDFGGPHGLESEEGMAALTGFFC